MPFWSDILRSNSGKSSKRLVMLISLGVVILFGGLLFIVEIKENNITLLKAIVDGLITVIVGVAVVSGAEKFSKVDKNENFDEK